MEKTGAVCVGTTPCDKCGKPSVAIVGKHSMCQAHAEEKQASQQVDLKSFTQPLQEVDDGTLRTDSP
jgi:hypothetical protein